MVGQGIDCLISDHLAKIKGAGANDIKGGSPQKRYVVSRTCVHPSVKFLWGSLFLPIVNLSLLLAFLPYRCTRYLVKRGGGKERGKGGGEREKERERRWEDVQRSKAEDPIPSQAN